MSFLLRDVQDSSDYEWIIKRHGVIYWEEQRWNVDDVEKLTKEIVDKFVEKHDPTRERCWIAEDVKTKDRLGCIFCVCREGEIAQLRLLLVDSKGRGLGVGSGLVNECVRFASEAGYSQMMLWTNHPLSQARRLYEKAGFKLVDEEPHHSFGHDLIGQNMWLDLKKL
jgi:GNAT superfamily N-acetyltransferase